MRRTRKTQDDELTHPALSPQPPHPIPPTNIMSTTLPSFLNLPLPGVPPPRAYPKAEPAAANGKGKAKAPPSPPPLRLGAEHAGVTMFRMSMSADNWAALLKTAKSGAKSGLRVDFGDDGQGVRPFRLSGQRSPR